MELSILTVSKSVFEIAESIWKTVSDSGMTEQDQNSISVVIGYKRFRTANFGKVHSPEESTG